MSQPHWKLYKSLGDRGRVFKDTTGVYPPEAEIWEEYRADGKTRFQVYRFALEQLHELSDGRVVDKYGHEEWFSDENSLKEVASSVDRTVKALKKAFCSNDVMKRLHAYEDVAGYYGYNNFDSDPLDLSEKELDKRERGPTARRVHTARYGWSRPGSRKRRR